MIKKGLVTEEALYQAWIEVTQGEGHQGGVSEGEGMSQEGASQGEVGVDLEGFLRLNVRLERLMDQAETESTKTNTQTRDKG